MRADLIQYVEKSRYLLLMLIAFFLPLNKMIIPVFIILLVISWLASGNLLSRLKGIRRNAYMWLFVSYYLIHLLGMIYTANMDFGWFDLEIKVSLLLFPLVLASIPRLSKDHMYKLSMSFVLGCLVAAIANMVIAYGNFRESGDYDDIMYTGLSNFLHTSYYSMYLCLALVMVLHYLIHPYEKGKQIATWIMALLTPFFVIAIIVLMAKSGVLTLCIILIVTFLYLLFTRRFIAWLILSAFITAGSVGAVHYVPDAFKRIKSTWIVATQASENRDNTTIESTAGRMMVWEQAIDLVKDNWIIGVGTGDIKDELVARYKSKGYSGIEEKRLNAHNQFLQSFGTLGVLGFLALVLGLIIPAIHAIRSKQQIYFMFILIIIANAMTESILEVQAGVIFYAFFNSLFMFLDPQGRSLKND